MVSVLPFGYCAVAFLGFDAVCALGFEVVLYLGYYVELKLGFCAKIRLPGHEPGCRLCIGRPMNGWPIRPPG